MNIYQYPSWNRIHWSIQHGGTMQPRTKTTHEHINREGREKWQTRKNEETARSAGRPLSQDGTPLREREWPQEVTEARELWEFDIMTRKFSRKKKTKEDGPHRCETRCITERRWKIWRTIPGLDACICLGTPGSSSCIAAPPPEWSRRYRTQRQTRPSRGSDSSSPNATSQPS